ncbi:C5-sterol desaturase [Agrocybe pediades]|nr:C5-sterol desaturase [Agrocybe pediades]
MDLVLAVCDHFVLNKAYARLVPIAAFLGPSGQNSTTYDHSTTSWLAATWFQIVPLLPHPPLAPHHQLASSSKHIDTVSAWPNDYFLRQALSLAVITIIGIHILYFLFAGLSYAFIFNHDMMRHPQFLKNQVRLEIITSMKALPIMTLLTLPIFLAEVRGHSMLYDDVDTYGYPYLVASVPFYLLFTDYSIYWIHRWLHIPAIYKRIHKPHHKWIIPTPFGSYAFHPLDGFAQSLPYHLFIFTIPLHRVLYIAMFVLINFWAIFIHDSDMITGHIFEKVINGPAHRTLHHLYFTVNYGQYFTWADRAGGSYRQPESHLDPLLEVKALDAVKDRKSK